MFGLGALAIGVVLMLWMRAVSPAFFRRQREVFDPKGVAVLYRSVTVVEEGRRA
jgi:hypothetical protein